MCGGAYISLNIPKGMKQSFEKKQELLCEILKLILKNY